MNYLAFLLPLLQELIQTIGPTVLHDINGVVGDLATKNNVTLTPTAAHAVPVTSEGTTN